MALSKKKSNIINKLKLYSSIANSNIDNNSLNDLISNTNDPIDFLLDVIKTTIGENVLETLVQSALSKIITQKKLNELSNKVYDSVGKTISENISSSTLNYNIPIKSIDPTKSLNKSSSTETNKFFKDVKDNVLNNANVDFPFTLVGVNKQITLKYVEQNDEINVNIPPISALELFNGLKGLIGPMFSANVIINEILNILFHTNFKNEDAQILTLVRSYTKYETKEVFKLDLKKLLDLELDTQIKGINIDTSCFRENIEITQAQIDNLVNNPTVSSFNALVPEFNTSTASNAKNDYYKNILKSIIEAIISIVLKQPVILFFITLINKIIDFNYDLNIPDIPTLIERLKSLFESIFDTIYEDLFCIIFNFIKKYVIKLVVLVTIQLIKEQLEKRGKILESLSGAKIKENLKNII
jgi:hypothetical protein